MKIILLFLAALASFTVQAQPPSQTVEQTAGDNFSAYSTGAYPERQSYTTGQYWLAGL